MGPLLRTLEAGGGGLDIGEWEIAGAHRAGIGELEAVGRRRGKQRQYRVSIEHFQRSARDNGLS